MRQENEHLPSGLGQRVLGVLAKSLLKLFFRAIDIVGLERVPRGTCLFVANHVNSLIDPAMLIAFLPKTPSFLAKSTLWEMTILRPFLSLASAIPVYRRHDPGVDVSRNAEMFARCHELLAEGNSIALFPEGVSHNEPALVGIKTGVSRIALETQRLFPQTRIWIVPIGLTFDEKSRFRSRALMVVGEPFLVPVEDVEKARCGDRAVEELTERVRQGLLAVTLNYPSWKEAVLIERAVEIYYRPVLDLPYELSLRERFEVHRIFIDAYESLRVARAELVEEVSGAVRDYDRLLEEIGIRDSHVAARYPPAGVVRFVLSSLLMLTLRLPFAVLGLVINFLPYQATSLVAERRDSTRSADLVATYKLIASLLFYPLTWFAASAVAAVLGGVAAGLSCVILAPSTGYLALRFMQRRSLFWNEARAFVIVRKHGAKAREARLAILQRVRKLADLYFSPVRGEQ